MAKYRFSILFFCFCFFSSSFLSAESDTEWREKTKLLIYSPRYFGPNAFPIPELRSGKVGNRYELEVRGEYHYFSGDQTTNFYSRAYLPLVKGRAGVEISFRFYEEYKMTPETRDERFAVETESPITCHGDVIISSFFQLLSNPKWLDALVTINLKTASGGRLCDARYTDAASYWFDLNLGKTLIKTKDERYSLRLQGLIGFYCWMTNDLVYRQNDAFSFGIGLINRYQNFTLTTDLSGFTGYRQNGDDPLILRNNLRYELKGNILSLRYDHGMKDRLYDSLSIGYIYCF